uniref:Uncharacterized protein n=1 Tax=Aquila chrysaetos chrysaetos TaxID=223781 RepID=A0A663DKK8_AQUCH
MAQANLQTCLAQVFQLTALSLWADNARRLTYLTSEDAKPCGLPGTGKYITTGATKQLLLWASFPLRDPHRTIGTHHRRLHFCCTEH